LNNCQCASLTADWYPPFPSLHADYYLLRRFLRARSYDLEKATVMWLNNVEFKKEFDIDHILENFEFGERAAFLQAYPQGYHKSDKLVGARTHQH
jgi:hypothetical protein